MLFAAGMGIGLLFWGVSEPLVHYLQPPPFLDPASPDSAAFAMRYSFFHWGVHPWAIYAIISLSIAYFSFRRGMPALISSCFYPILGDRIYGLAGNLVDVLAVFATVFGTATSLGFGALQIHSGLTHLYGISSAISVTIGIIIIATALFMASAIMGVEKGVQVLSKFNIVLAVALLLFILALGSTPTSSMSSPPPSAATSTTSSTSASSRIRLQGLSGAGTGRSSTGRGGSRGRRLWASSSRGSPGAGRSGSSS